MERLLRLRESELTDIERVLLDAADEDRPARGAEEQCLAMFGLGAGSAMAGAAATHGVGHAASAVRAAALGATAKGAVPAFVIAKWVGLGALVGVVVAGSVATVTVPSAPRGADGVRAPDSAVARTPQPNTRPATSPVRELDPRGEMPSMPASPRAAEAVVSRSGAPRLETQTATRADVPPSVAGAPAAAPPLASSVVEEVRSLDAARAALSAGDPRAALARLDEHERRFPAGTLEPEDVVLRVRALRDLGEWAEATRVANAFIASHPDSAQAARLRALVGAR